MSSVCLLLFVCAPMRAKTAPEAKEKQSERRRDTITHDKSHEQTTKEERNASTKQCECRRRSKTVLFSSFTRIHTCMYGIALIFRFFHRVSAFLLRVPSSRFTFPVALGAIVYARTANISHPVVSREKDSVEENWLGLSARTEGIFLIALRRFFILIQMKVFNLLIPPTAFIAVSSSFNDSWQKRFLKLYLIRPILPSFRTIFTVNVSGGEGGFSERKFNGGFCGFLIGAIKRKNCAATGKY